MNDHMKTIAIDTASLAARHAAGPDDDGIPKTIRVDAEEIVRRLQEERDASAPPPAEPARTFPRGAAVAAAAVIGLVVLLLLVR